VQLEIGRRLFVDLLEKPQEFPAAMAGHAIADDHAGEHVERREQRGSAVTLVIVGHRAGPALLHRQSRLGAVERLDPALLVDTRGCAC
jgi:hypothetical protein